MYTLLQLESKTFGELKKIGYELNVLPEGDRRRRQSWIDAIAGVNPPLLQLLEVPPAEVQAQESPIIETVEASPAVEVEQPQEPPIESKFGRIVYPRPAQKAIALAAETSPGVESVELTQKAQDHKFLLCLKDGDNTLWYDGKDFVFEKWSAKTYCRRGVGAAKHQLRSHPEVKRAGNVLQVVENSPRVEVKPIAQEVIAQVTETSPGVDLDDELPECNNCFGDGYVKDEFGFVKFCQCETEPRLSHQRTQRAIAPAAKNRSEEGSDQNPILTGIALSDRFLARYAPPQSETLHYEVTDSYNVDTDGQLSLFDVQVQSPPELPDPDDFESLDAFREAIARWDLEHPTSSSDRCSDHLPSSVHCELNSVPCEPLEVSLDSFCEWAPCPDEWYEPAALLEQSKVSELSPTCKSSITSDFSIPTFGRWGDRSNGSDEPPDTGIFARLPKPKPPTLPPQAASWTQVGHKLDTSQPKSAQVRLSQASRNYPETIPKLFPRLAAGSSNQPARSPPGGDA
jgi:hypothetical protein